MHLHNTKQILNHSIFKTKKAFQNHAQAAVTYQRYVRVLTYA